MNANHLFSRFSALISTIGVRKERASWRPPLILYGAYAEFLNTLTSSQHYFFQSLDKLVGIAVLRQLCELSGVCSKVLYLLQSSALRREHLSTHTGLVRTSRTKRIVRLLLVHLELVQRPVEVLVTPSTFSPTKFCGFHSRVM